MAAEQKHLCTQASGGSDADPIKHPEGSPYRLAALVVAGALSMFSCKSLLGDCSVTIDGRIVTPPEIESGDCTLELHAANGNIAAKRLVDKEFKVGMSIFRKEQPYTLQARCSLLQDVATSRPVVIGCRTRLVTIGELRIQH